MKPHCARLVALYAASGAIALALAGIALARSTPPVRGNTVTLTDDELARTLRASPVPPPPSDPTNAHADDPGAIHLGNWLFFEERLSASGGISCATCHNPYLGLSDRKPLSVGHDVGEFNSPHLWGVGHNRWHFWDGRAETLWQQALAPLENHVEMGSTRTAIVILFARDAELRTAYEKVFGAFPFTEEEALELPADATPFANDPEDLQQKMWMRMDEGVRDRVNEAFVNIGKAIAAFERTIMPPEAPFDRYVRGLETGDPELLGALSPEAERGLKLFMGEANCFLCHSGPMFTDGEFHNTRVAPERADIPPHRGRDGAFSELKRAEFGSASRWSDAPDGIRAQITAGLQRTPHNWGQFKTPSLRQAAETMPYMHRGQFATLRDCVEHYSTFEGALPPDHHAIPDPLLRPLALSEAEIDALVAFLESLTGEVGGLDRITEPSSPIPD